MMEDQAIADAAQLLNAHADYRVIRRIIPRDSFAESNGKNLLKGVVVDTETTGINADKDAII